MQQSYHYHSETAEDTRALGSRLAQYLRHGDVLLLSGELGAGKSEFCRGLARGLGIAGSVPSPSFTILNLYEEGRLPFKHFDWYRVNGAEEMLEAGLDEQIGQEGVTAIEWHERAPELLPQTHLLVRLAYHGEDGRDLAFVPEGGFHTLPWQDILKEAQA